MWAFQKGYCFEIRAGLRPISLRTFRADCSRGHDVIARKIVDYHAAFGCLDEYSADHSSGSTSSDRMNRTSK